MTNRQYSFAKGINGHSEIALYVDTFEEVDTEFDRTVKLGARPVLEPTTNHGDSAPVILQTPKEI